ncbi:MAG: UvrD-helicase domain-containing protein, partial [Bacteroidales bacterium]|nr:UvrD-helicase domain-containing protein [Bacteroidales bacterium]
MPSQAIDEMIAKSHREPLLREWLRSYVLSNISAEKSWNLKNEISSLSRELFRENFRILSADQQDKLSDKEFLAAYIKKLRDLSAGFEAELRTKALKASAMIENFGLTDEMFYQKGRGVASFVRSHASGTVREPNQYVRAALGAEPRWFSAKRDPRLEEALTAGFGKAVADLVTYYDIGIVTYNTAASVLSDIYTLGILSDVLFNVRSITASGNIFLLSDTGEFLSLITGAAQTPFIYEKTGNRYETFMIDEFQDTSVIQWRNFSPLIENSMSEGNDNLVVGDVKQSIYRWRNSDWKILGRDLAGLVDGERHLSRKLERNWRSRTNIISFNNSLFSVLPALADAKLGTLTKGGSLTELYSGAVQIDPAGSGGGYVRIEFIEENDDLKWEEIVISLLPGYIEAVQDKGYAASDIGIIVRESRQGAMVLKALIDHRNSMPEDYNSRYNFNVVSDDSLLLSSSHAVNFIIAVLSYLNDPEDNINRALMLRSLLLARNDDRAGVINLEAGSLPKIEELIFPKAYSEFFLSLRNLSLFESAERIIGFFSLGGDINTVAYLNCFQDNMLEFAGNRNPGLPAFLDWWESSGRNKSVVLPGSQESIRILTIHKSKGLEFKVVVLPFISWNLDHKSSMQPYLWVRPSAEPFSELGIVPVKYSGTLENTFFRQEYEDEKYSSWLDNINLLYVAFTRARDVLIGFSPLKEKGAQGIAALLSESLRTDISTDNKELISLAGNFYAEKNCFEFGTIPVSEGRKEAIACRRSEDYLVTGLPGKLRLKLHGENYFSSEPAEMRKKINYGKLMHEILASVNTSADLQGTVRRLVLEGRIPEDDAAAIEQKLLDMFADPLVSEWFAPGNEILTETSIIFI